PLLYTIGLFLGATFFAVLGHVLLAFPGGRLEGRVSRLLVTAGDLDTIVVVGIGNLFYDGAPGGTRNLALVDANATLSDALQKASRGIGIPLLTLTPLIPPPRPPLATRDATLAPCVRARLLVRFRRRPRLRDQHRQPRAIPLARLGGRDRVRNRRRGPACAHDRPAARDARPRRGRGPGRG